MKAESTNIGALINKITPFTSELASTKDFNSLTVGIDTYSNTQIYVFKYTYTV